MSPEKLLFFHNQEGKVKELLIDGPFTRDTSREFIMCQVKGQNPKDITLITFQKLESSHIKSIKYPLPHASLKFIRHLPEEEQKNVVSGWVEMMHNADQILFSTPAKIEEK